MGRGGWHFENFSSGMRAIDLILRATGLLRVGQRNALDLVLRERRQPVHDLPGAFDGLRILHQSDLHLDGHPGFGSRIAEAIRGQPFDLCVLTGDFRFYDTGRYAQLDAELGDLMPALACRFGIYGILGNHDFIEMVPAIERSGVRMLLNEAVALEADGSTLWLVGLDDAHFYGMEDFDRAGRGIPAWRATGIAGALA